MDFFMHACASWVERAVPVRQARWAVVVLGAWWLAAAQSVLAAPDSSGAVAHAASPSAFTVTPSVTAWPFPMLAQATTPSPAQAPSPAPAPDNKSGAPDNKAGAPTAPTPPTVSRVNQFSLERSGESLYMTVRMQFDLPDAAKEALLKGVSLFFSAEVSTLRPRWYWRDEYLVLDRLYWRLNFLPLSRRWRLQQANEPWDKQGGLISDKLFDDLPAALQALQTIERWPLRDKTIILSNRENKLTFTFELDQFLLPRPLVVGNLANDVWKLKMSRDLNLIVSEAGR